jgi:hypothetical protein
VVNHRNVNSRRDSKKKHCHTQHQTSNALTVCVAEKPIDDDKDDDHAEAAATEFFCAVTGNQCPKEVVHKKVFAVKKV